MCPSHVETKGRCSPFQASVKNLRLDREERCQRGKEKFVSFTISSLVFALWCFPFNPALCGGDRYPWERRPAGAAGAAGIGHAPFTFAATAINSACLS